MALHNRDYMGGAAPSSFASGRRRLNAVGLLIAINVIVYLCWVFGAEQTLTKHFLASAKNLEAGRYWVLLTSGFFHIDFIHLVSTLAMLYLAGKAVQEDTSGGNVILVYVLASLAAALLLQVWWVKPAVPLPGGLPSAPPPGVSSGTGFYVGEKLVLTNAHVVKDNETVSIQAPGGGVVKGKVKAKHEQLDLALVSVDTTGAVLALCEPSIRGGRTVFAFGYGVLAGTTDTLLQTRGAISAIQDGKGRIVFDAKVNPGNSGGPLVDADGRWVGVVVAKSHVGQGLDSLSYAVEGRAAARWIESVGGAVTRSEVPPKGTEPPDAVRSSVVRVLTGGPLSVAGAPALFWFDHRIFGAGAGVLALLALALLRDWRRTVFSAYYVPLFFLAILFALADLTGSLRVHTPFSSLAHGYHLVGAAVGFALFKLQGPRGRFRDWLKGRIKRLVGGKPPDLKVLEGGKGKLEVVVPDTFPAELELPSKLDAATRARMDELLGIISERGIDALTPEERAFLEQTSKKLKE